MSQKVTTTEELRAKRPITIIIRAVRSGTIEALGYVEQDKPDSGGTHGRTLG
jgi:hypothetical protein